jgi:hypothetical protein
MNLYIQIKVLLNAFLLTQRHLTNTTDVTGTVVNLAGLNTAKTT